VGQVTDKSVDAALLTDHDIRSARKRSHGVLISGQVLSGVGMGATFSAGALLVAQVSGSEAWSGMAATFSTIGAAIAAIPLAALANRSGRAPALATGALIAALGAVVGLVAAVIVSFPLLLLGILMLGFGSAVNLQSRFAATDLSEPTRRGRDLAIVVWSTTVGAVLGPNLIQPADEFGQWLGLPPLSGPFVFSLIAQLLAGALYLIGLRPDPLKLATRIGIERPVAPEAAPRVADTNGVATGIVAISLSTAVMVSVMSMTPVHLVHQGASLAIVGLTISLHVLGMFGLSPVFGLLADRVGREFTIAVGQVLLLIALLVTAIGAETEAVVTVGLVLIGLGWSAATVAGSTLVAESADLLHRTRTQGRADLLQSATGALGGAAAGLVLALLGYSGLALVAISLVAAVLATLIYRVFVVRRVARPVVE
jgi:MFS family permease